MNNVNTFELNSHDLDEVNGGILPAVIIVAFAAGFAAGRASKK